MENPFMLSRANIESSNVARIGLTGTLSHASSKNKQVLVDDRQPTRIETPNNPIMIQILGQVGTTMLPEAFNQISCLRIQVDILVGNSIK